VLDFNSKGVTTRPFDLDNFTSGDAEKLFKGIDVVIAAFKWTDYYGRTQYALIDSAKKAGVSRFVPCDFASSCVRGVRDMFDIVCTFLSSKVIGALS